MPALESYDCQPNGVNPKALLWTKIGDGRNAELYVRSEVELVVRWDPSNAVVLDATGNTIGVDATVVVDREIAIGSLMWLGSLDDVPMVQDQPTPTTGLMEVVVYKEAKDVKQRHVRRVVNLKRFNSEMPTVVLRPVENVFVVRSLAQRLTILWNPGTALGEDNTFIVEMQISLNGGAFLNFTNDTVLASAGTASKTNFGDPYVGGDTVIARVRRIREGGTPSVWATSDELVLQDDLTADFTSDVTDDVDDLAPTTTDSIQFQDLTNLSPTSWVWSVSVDGGAFQTFSTVQNPLLALSTLNLVGGEQLTIRLVASTGFGSDTETKSNYITVQENS